MSRLLTHIQRYEPYYWIGIAGLILAILLIGLAFGGPLKADDVQAAVVCNEVPVCETCEKLNPKNW